MIPYFQYYQPKTVREACAILAEKGSDALILAGGTDTLVKMKDGSLKPCFLVDIKHIPGLDRISLNSSLHLGALTTIGALETSPEIRQVYPALAHAAGSIGSVQVRNLATVGGNLCNAAPSADTAPILIALSAKASIRGPKGRRRSLDLEQFFLGPGKTTLLSDEILTGLRVPLMPSGAGASYYKLSIRRAMDIAIVGVAAVVILDGDTCKDCRIVLGAVAPTPLRARKAEEVLRRRKLSPELLRKTGEAAAAETSPISDVRASAEYRKDMVEIITRRALEQAVEQARRQQ